MEKELYDALQRMMGYATYAEDCDPWYFNEENAEFWQADLANAKAVVAKYKESNVL
jgi:hypothetical protein